MNKAVLIGRITKDAELKQAGNTQCVNFTLAVERKFKDKDGNKITDFINCVAWAGSANFLNQYSKKGDLIAVSGSVETRNYEKDGKTIYITEIRCDEVKILSSSSKKENHMTENNGFNNVPSFEVEAEDLPFY